MSDSKGAAIRAEIRLLLPVQRGVPSSEEARERAVEAILAILAQEVKRKTILELKRLQAYGLNHEITTSIIEDRIKAIERLG